MSSLERGLLHLADVQVVFVAVCALVFGLNIAAQLMVNWCIELAWIPGIPL